MEHPIVCVAEGLSGGYTANTHRVTYTIGPKSLSQTQTLSKYISYIVLKMLTTRRKFHLEKSGVPSLVK